MLNSNTNGTRYANAGTVCIASRTGRRTCSRRACRAGQDPDGDPDQQGDARPRPGRASSVIEAVGPQTEQRQRRRSRPRRGAPSSNRRARRRSPCHGHGDAEPGHPREQELQLIDDRVDAVPERVRGSARRAGSSRWCVITQSPNALNGFGGVDDEDSREAAREQDHPQRDRTATVRAIQTARRRHGEAGAWGTTVRSVTCCTSRSGTATCSGLHHGGEHRRAVDDAHLGCRPRRPGRAARSFTTSGSSDWRIASAATSPAKSLSPSVDRMIVLHRQHVRSRDVSREVRDVVVGRMGRRPLRASRSGRTGRPS